MIAFVKGLLDEVNEDSVVIDVNGVGYNVNISTLTASHMPPIGKEVKLYTYTLLRTDDISLCGFLTKEELLMFKKLLSVNSIGPKAGLAILSIASAEDIRYAILSGDTKLISSAPGVGKKTAERVILELKDKFSWNDSLISKEIKINDEIKDNSFDNEIKKQAVAALVALGYSASEAHKALMDEVVADDTDVEQLLKRALNRML